MNTVVYARYSSHKQGDQPIEGQLTAAYKYAGEHGYTSSTSTLTGHRRAGTTIGNSFSRC